jgi:pilus assembly protein Flp/PilA
MELCSHSENYVFRESANPIHRVTDATVARRSIFLAHSGLGRGNQRANLSTGARVLRHEEVQEAGHRDSRSIEHCASCLEVPLTVQVGKFFKSWVQGSYCRRLEHPSCRCQEDVVLKLLFSGFWADRSAATAIEYGLVMAGIALAILAALNGVGTSISRILTTVSSSLR